MKNTFLLTFLSVILFSCSVEVKEPGQENTSPDDEATPEVVVPAERNPLQGMCSFNNNPNKGCLKATIANADLYVGDFYYNLGPAEFARVFAEDLQDSYHVSLEVNEHLELTRQVTHQNFYQSFRAGVEGAHTTYNAFHTGLGNIRIDNMSPGYYEVQLSKEFELRVVNDTYQVTGYICAVIWAQRPVDIQFGKESSLGESVSEFELRVFDQSCSGTKKVKTKQVETPTDTVTDSDNGFDDQEDDQD